MDDQGEQRPKPPSGRRSTGGSRQQQQPPADDGNDGKHKKRHRKHKVEKKYEGYEELLVEDEDMPIDDVPQPTGELFLRYHHATITFVNVTQRLNTDYNMHV